MELDGVVLRGCGGTILKKCGVVEVKKIVLQIKKTKFMRF